MSMIALEIFLNGEKLVTAGAEDCGTLNAVVTLSGKLGNLAENKYWINEDGSLIENDLSLWVAGSKSTPEERWAMLWWINFQELNVGDVLTINLIETDTVDEPISITTEANAGGFSDERDMFEKVKKKYFELRDKYESVAQ
ncbi:MAG: hypothetical protein HZA22_00935 [Nitrospirae bacterium]|nr:hypothetical protein [Nitrospirota bacterium]